MPSYPADYGFYFRCIHDSMLRHANRTLAARNLTMSQMHILMALYHAPEKTRTLKELEGVFHNAQSTVAGLVQRLEKKSLVSCAVSPDDRRVKVVCLTDGGGRACRNAHTDMLPVERLIASCMSPEEQTTLRTLLARVCETLRADDLTGKDDDVSPCEP